MEIKTQGSELYLLDTDGAAVLKIECINSFEGLGGSAGDIDVTCFDDLNSRRFLTGLIDNGTATFGMAYDPTSTAQQKLAGIAGGGLYKWAIGLSDGYGLAPTYDAGPPPDFVFPSGRTYFTFEASVQQFQRSAAVDDVWRISVSLRVSGDIAEIPA